MRLLVVGAAGRVGRHLVRQALAAGHEVVAFARDPSKIGVTDRRLSFVAGDATDPVALAGAARGCDAALSAIGGKPTTGPRSFIEDATRGVIAGLERAGVRRLVTIGTRSLALGPGGRDVPPALRAALEDHARALRLLEASGLEWTVICPPHMPEGAATGSYRLVVDGSPEPHGPIATGDVAHAALAALPRADLGRRRVGVAGLPDTGPAATG